MLSIEMAKKLKEAGLVWNPDIGDIFFYDEGHWDSLSLNDVINGEFKGEILDYIEEEWLFAPRLDQLLVEIEKRDWEIDLQFFNNGTGWFCEVAKTVQFRHNKPRPKLTINNKDGTTKEVEPISTCPGWGDYGEKRMDKEFTADTPEDAVAQALLWILGNPPGILPISMGR